MSEEVHQQLEELPDKCTAVKKQAVVMKQSVSPLQMEECGNIRRKLITVDVRQHESREQFRRTAPFQFQATHHYIRIDNTHREISVMEHEMTELYEAAGLFEVNAPEFKQLKACHRGVGGEKLGTAGYEVGMLKVLWDMVTLVRSSFADWNTTLWRDINVKNMELDCKRFVKDICGLDKEMRAWNVFAGLDSTVKNMVTSLRAVGERQNPAIRGRHWEQLMQATQNLPWTSKTSAGGSGARELAG